MAPKNLKKCYPIEFCFTLEIIRVLSRLTIQNFIRKQTVLKKKRNTHPKKTKKHPKIALAEADMLLTFFSEVIQKIFVQDFTKKTEQRSKNRGRCFEPKSIPKWLPAKRAMSDKVFIKR